jgi:hypothetical protein
MESILPGNHGIYNTSIVNDTVTCLYKVLAYKTISTNLPYKAI